MNQKQWIKILRRDGWEQERGGKHVVKMTRLARTDHVADAQGQRLRKRLGWAIRREAGDDPGTRMKTMDLIAEIDEEDGMYWAQVEQLPGCFASGESIPFSSRHSRRPSRCTSRQPESRRRS